MAAASPLDEIFSGISNAAKKLGSAQGVAVSPETQAFVAGLLLPRYADLKTSGQSVEDAVTALFKKALEQRDSLGHGKPAELRIHDVAVAYWTLPPPFGKIGK
jgi:hypothetical protein